MTEAFAIDHNRSLVRTIGIFVAAVLVVAVTEGTILPVVPVLAQTPSISVEAPIVILVRHADKEAEPADDPALTTAGRKRAQDLAETLRDAGVTAIITTELRRTRETAAPLADILALTPEVIGLPVRGEEAEQHFKAVEAAVRRHQNGVVLVVGHDSTIPGIISALGGPKLPYICPTVYDNFFMLMPRQGKTILVRGRYGAPSGERSSDCM